MIRIQVTTVFCFIFTINSEANLHRFSHFPQVHKRATECINACNILEKTHLGDCPKNLLQDNSILQQLKVFLVCLFVCLFILLFI